MPQLRFNNETIYVEHLYYIGVDGDDNNDGSYESPFKTFQKAVETASSGDGIEFLPGDYVLPRRNFGETSINNVYYNHASLRYTGILFGFLYDLGKELVIYGSTTETRIFANPGDDNNVHSLFYFINSKTKTIRLNIFSSAPKTSLSVNLYRNASDRYYTQLRLNLFLAYQSRGRISNVIIDIEGQGHADWGGFNDNVIFENCIINENNRIHGTLNLATGRYTRYRYHRQVSRGNMSLINCLVNRNITSPSNSYCLFRDILSQDYEYEDLVMRDDIRHKGSPVIYNPDQTRSHIGVLGGPYSWSFNAVADITIRSFRHLEIINRREITLKSLRVFLHRGPLGINNYDNYSYSNQHIDTSKYNEILYVDNLQNKEIQEIINLELVNQEREIPEGISFIRLLYEHENDVSIQEMYYLMRYKNSYFIGKYIYTVEENEVSVSPRRVFFSAKSDLVEIDLNRHRFYCSRDGGETFIRANYNQAMFSTEGGEDDKRIILVATSTTDYKPDRVGYFWV